jgi:hypothetical protein
MVGIQCPDGTYFIDGNYTLQSYPYVSMITSSGNTMMSVWTHTGGGSLTITAGSDDAAFIFRDMSQFVPTALTKFYPYSRSMINVKVVSDSTGTSKYSPSSDYITIYHNMITAYRDYAIWGPMHEYGHAFQEKALVSSTSGFNCPTHHYVDSLSVMTCSMGEGFADAFGAYVAGDSLVNNTVASDYSYEQDVWRTIGDGSRIEGAVAAFMYDLLDSSTNTNSSTNTAATEDDATAYPGSFLGSLIKNCRLYAGGLVYKPQAVDGLIYCAEYGLSGQTLASTFFPSETVTFDSVKANTTQPTGWSQTNIRSIWRHDLMNN